MTRGVVDPGVFVSAFISPRRSAPAILVDAFLDGHFDVIVSPKLITELTTVLDRPKFSTHAAEGRAGAFVAALVDRGVIVKDSSTAAGATADPDDDYLVALARTHRAEAIISGDRHLLDAKSDDLAVWTPRELVERLDLAGRS